MKIRTFRIPTAGVAIASIAAALAGVAHAHVEQDQSPDPVKSIGMSMDYLKGL